MPKIKKTTASESGITEITKEFVKTLKSKAAYYDLENEELALSAHVSIATIYNKLRKPGNFTLDEFLRLSNKLHFTTEDYIQIFNLKMPTKPTVQAEIIEMFSSMLNAANKKNLG